MYHERKKERTMKQKLPSGSCDILYIGGAGRSGSTLLELIIGNLPGYFSIGEVCRFFEYILHGKMRCGCGERLNECEFWSKIMDRLESKNVDIERMAHLNNCLTRTRNFHKLLFYSKTKYPPEWHELLRGIEALYYAIADLSGGKILVDSSKTPSQSICLKQIPGLNIKVIQMVRDGRAVAYSWAKRKKSITTKSGKKAYMPQRSYSSSMIRWAMENYWMGENCGDVPNTLLKYEEFVSNPYQELKRVLDDLDLDSKGLEMINAYKMNLSKTHSVGGNFIRFSTGKMAIRPDMEWKNNLSKWKSVYLGLITLPLMKKYHYPIF
jgi:hypothetical protein